MKRDGKRQSILDLLIVGGAVELGDLANHFAVSKMTIYSDFDDVKQLGMLRNIRSGVTIEPATQLESDHVIKGERPAAEAVAALSTANIPITIAEPLATIENSHATT